MSWSVDLQLEEYESVVYAEIYSGVSPVVVANVYELKLLKNSRKDNSFSKKSCGSSQLLLTLVIKMDLQTYLIPKENLFSIQRNLRKETKEFIYKMRDRDILRVLALAYDSLI